MDTDTIPVPPPVPGAAPRPLLALDKEELRLSSPRGDVVSGAITLTNRGVASLDGTVVARVGADWLRVEPSYLRLEPGESRRVEVRADPATLPHGYTGGEIEVVTNGGSATVSVRIGVRTGRSWRLLALAIAASAIVAAVAGVALAGVKIPAATSPPAPPAGTSTASRHGSHGQSAPTPLPSFNRAAALADIRSAIYTSNVIWMAALAHPATADLGTIKTGQDLAADTATVQALLAGGEHWAITQQRFRVLSVQVSADGAGGWGEVQKTEQRALYGPGHERVPYELSAAAYDLRYSLVRQNGRWLVSDVAVQSLTPLSTSGPALTVQQVASRVLPAVVRVEADSFSGTAVGTGIIIQSSAASSYIITNDHVVTGANSVNVLRWSEQKRAYDPSMPWTATKVQEDQNDDLAVIRIDQGNLPVATWGNSEALVPGQSVVAIGYAEDLSGGPTVTDGIVSSLRRTEPDKPDGPFFIGHSATINHGNSGGPLTDMSGHVVGINTWTLDNTQGLFFAIPSSRAAPVAANDIGSNG